MSSEYLQFEDALERLGLSEHGLKLEGFRTDGTSNYVGNLNFHGQTWSAVLRMPAKGATVEDFLTDKQQALAVADYLSKELAAPVDVGFDCALTFDGQSMLVDGASTQEFLKRQVASSPLQLIYEVGGATKEIKGITYPGSLDADVRNYISEYSGPFYLSRGAPASETLEDFPHMVEPAAHALAALQRKTGQGQPVSFDDAVEVLESIAPAMAEAAERWTPADGSKESNALAKSLTKWNPENDPTKEKLIRAERFLRSKQGGQLYRGLLVDALSKISVPDNVLKSFTHGDMHGGNLIFVEYLYQANREVLLDRQFVNSIFQKNQQLESLGVRIEDDGNVIRLIESSDEEVVLRRKRHYDIHLIDFDSGTGVTPETKLVHLVDALFLAVSAANITTLFADAVAAEDVLRMYYDGLRT